MKTFLTTTFAILLFTITCKAQWTGGGAGTASISQTTLTNPVGIGTATPDAFLNVVKSDNTSFTMHVTNAGSTAKTVLISAGNSGSDATLLQVTNFANTSNFFTVTDGNSYFENGNVGIGTTTPDAQLAMSRADNTNYNLHITNVGGMAKGVLISGGNTSSDATLLRVTNSTNTVNFFTVTDGNSYFENGNVGIGTTAPDQKLTVNGTVHSKAVIVDNSIFPDYVFKKTYVLRPLSAVKTYIDLNHHLPEMPSAAEVAKNGQNLGEINALLLKKVEELTLYMIELNKTVKAQQQEIEILKKK